MAMKPPPQPVRNSSWLPIPPRIGWATLVDSNSSHSSQPASHLRRRRLRTCHEPIQKSKSRAVDPACACWPMLASSSDPFGDVRHASRRIGRNPPARLDVVLATTSRLLELLELLQSR